MKYKSVPTVEIELEDSDFDALSSALDFLRKLVKISRQYQMTEPVYDGCTQAEVDEACYVLDSLCCNYFLLRDDFETNNEQEDENDN